MSTAIYRPVRLPESFLMFNFKENIGSVDQTFDILQECLILCFYVLNASYKFNLLGQKTSKLCFSHRSFTLLSLSL